MKAILFAGLLVFALAAIPLAEAKNASLSLTVKESGCPDGRTYCWSVQQGSLADIQKGDVVNVTFTNTGSMDHEALFTTTAIAGDEHNDTTEDGLIAGIEDVEAGKTGSTTFTSPVDGDELYLWCAEPGHEALGMWLTAAASGAGGNATGNDTEESTSNGVPGLPLVGALVAVGLVALLLRGRRR